MSEGSKYLPAYWKKLLAPACVTLALIIICFAGFIYFKLQTKDFNINDNPRIKVDGSVITINSPDYLLTESNGDTYHLRANKYVQNAAFADFAKLEKFVIIQQSKSRPPITISGDNADINITELTGTLSGNISISKGDRYRMDATEAQFNMPEGIYASNLPSKILFDGGSISSGSINISETAGAAEFSKDVRTVVTASNMPRFSSNATVKIGHSPSGFASSSIHKFCIRQFVVSRAINRILMSRNTLIESRLLSYRSLDGAFVFSGTVQLHSEFGDSSADVINIKAGGFTELFSGRYQGGASSISVIEAEGVRLHLIGNSYLVARKIMIDIEGNVIIIYPPYKCKTR